jgi:glycosyltransferase involved in cell wall biosynthesis
MAVRKVTIITASDLSVVQGSTEAHYVAKFLTDQYDTHIYSPINPEITDATYHKIPSASVLPALILYNFILVPYFLIQNYLNKYDVVYTYGEFHLTPILMSALGNTTWIADFRTKPTEQAKEWKKSSGGYNLIVAAYYCILDILFKLTLQRAEKIVTLSKPIKNDLVRNYGVSEKKISIVPLGVETTKFEPETLQKPLEEPFDIIYMGSISRRRGIGTCIDAIASEELQVDVNLHLVGDGPRTDLDKLKAKTKAENVKESVQWHGYVDHEKIPTVLDRMDIAISPLPAYDSYEVSSPAKIYEYLSMGLPIICSDIGAHRNVLYEERTGFFFTPDSRLSLVESINQIGKFDQEAWIEIRQQARSKGEENDWSRRMDTIRTVIEEANHSTQ